MAVKLHIVADAYDGARVEPFEVPNGHTVTVRRHSQGADVFVTPGAKAAEVGPSDELPPDVARRIRSMAVIQGVDHPDLVTLDILDGQLKRHRLLVRPSDLAYALPTDSEAQPAPPSLPGLDPDEEYSLARARLTNAQAERVEMEVAATRRALSLCDDSPLAGYSVSVDHEQHRPGERILRISFDDGAGRTAVVALPFALALKLNGSIGRAVAERLDASGGV